MEDRSFFPKIYMQTYKPDMLKCRYVLCNFPLFIESKFSLGSVRCVLQQCCRPLRGLAGTGVPVG